jgi:hypothetical protein
MIVADRYKLARYPKKKYLSPSSIRVAEANIHTRKPSQIPKPFGTNTARLRTSQNAMGTAMIGQMKALRPRTHQSGKPRISTDNGHAGGRNIGRPEATTERDVTITGASLGRAPAPGMWRSPHE